MATPQTQVRNLDFHNELSEKTSAANRSVTIVSVLIFVLGFFLLNANISLTHALLFLVTGIMGMALYHAHFGFTSSFRSLIV